MELDGARVLVFGTAGAQGSGLVPALTAAGGHDVRATRRPERAREWVGGGARAVVADLADPASVRAAAEGVDAALLHFPLSLATPEGALAVVGSIRELRAAGLPVVANMGCPVPEEGATHLRGVRMVAEAVADLGATVLAPTAYLDNHAEPWALRALAGGELIYPRPADDVVAWVSAVDVGAAAVAALAAELPGELLGLAGAAPLSFGELAAELGAGLGRRVGYRRVSPREYGEPARPVLGSGFADWVIAEYEARSDAPSDFLAADTTDTWARLGVAPMPARRWAATVLAPALAGAR
ncbi:Uncharacterized conserved protein YbjT, contains NAD(P)-binding and DUF2867 domains [Amycolatopsis arida]|uniref:Uncharacterized conserved protein YbjT, contains NAD(P)-binding and DUF2867 domains n=1 Tax=Amycolatopsis arida TaxID=587909 RepID=A0A1I6ATA0_9PSEU|nr:NmrA family NAD(P)-binding protein [Amycolatopsis arida]TDX97534.1 uncharacterized protein YbjT (DUF2867 family) [Amycolatopsis arida]SFQ71940.1 Uncharacterized conserved protein YbjT, contains NAD(P)-binding and DUF2867 domains [Amycolatopsis arida]